MTLSNRAVDLFNGAVAAPGGDQPPPSDGPILTAYRCSRRHLAEASSVRSEGNDDLDAVEVEAWCSGCWAMVPVHEVRIAASKLQFETEAQLQALRNALDEVLTESL
jgi:hypothetical protein